MKLKNILLALTAFIAYQGQAAEIRYSGGDISLLPEYEAAGSIYKDEDGNKIRLLPYMHEIGMNAMRVRLFVDPAAFEAAHPSDYDPNACQSLPYIIPLCKDIVDNGFELMLDFHYSDTWADPAKQWLPIGWENLTDEELKVKIYDYTKETLLTLQENGITPTFIQPGNEISYGMLWGPFGQDNPGNHTSVGSSNESWVRFGDLLTAAISACREICPKAQIVIHTERVAQVNVLTNFYDRMARLKIDYDIIGLSYYPYHHGPLTNLDNALTSVEKRYPDKPIMIVETGCPIWWEMGNGTDYPLSLEGQNQFATELVEILLQHKNVNGLFWWWLEYNPYGTQLTNWYNAPLFDPKTGKATPALKTIASYATPLPDDAAIDYIESETGTGAWYDVAGRKVSGPEKPGLYIHDGKKILVK